ncbi:MAG: reverse transcriptase domain-containing protein [Candidatus Thiodiazotropha sp.]
MTPVLTRLIEAVLKFRIKPKLLSQQNGMQRGFTENSSPMNCALIVEEFFRNNKDLHKPTYMAFMDAKSAFDVVVHPNLMRKLYKTGVNTHEWLTINSLHEGSMTSVKWQGEMSPMFTNEQGVRQGGVLSADLYKLFINDLLDRLEATEKGARIGNINISAPTCADDVTVLSNDPESLQFLISICKDSSCLNGYVLHDLKSVVLQMNSIPKYPDGESWVLGANEMPVVQNTTHMGIFRTSVNQDLQAVESNIQKAHRVVYSLMGAGLHGENGVDPETAMSLLNTYVIPVLLFGLEVIVPTGKALDVLERHYKRLLKQLLSLPSTAADPAIYLLSGMLPVEAVLHKRILSLFGNITRLPDDSVELRLAKRQLEIKSFSSHSWFVAVKKVLVKYDLPDAVELIQAPPGKFFWKRQCNRSINDYWKDRIISQAKLYSSLKYLSKSFKIGKCHPAVKPHDLSIRDINRIPVMNKILTGTYILQTNRVKFNQNEVNPTCQLCNSTDETLQHFVIDCKYLKSVRDPVLFDIKKLIKDLLEICPEAARYSLLQLIVDCGVVSDLYPVKDLNQLSECIDLIYYHSRRLLFVLHAERYKKLELSSKTHKMKKVWRST